MHPSIAKLVPALLLATAAHGAQALGFGPLPSTAVLGQPLDITIPIRLEPGEELSSACITTEVSFADNAQQAGVINKRLDEGPPGSSDRRLRIVTNTRIDEPVVTVQVAIGCGSTVSRRFTLFADPPLVQPVAAQPSRATPSAAASTPQGEGGRPSLSASLPVPRVPGTQYIPVTPTLPAPTPPVAAASPAAPAPPRPARPAARSETNETRAASRPSRPTVAARPAAPRASEAPAASRPPAAPEAGTNARLQLSTLEAGARAAAPSAAAVAASAAAADAAAQAAASAPPAAASDVTASASAATPVDTLAQDRARMVELEASLNKLQSDTAATQQTIASLQARLQQAEADRFENPLVYALLGLIALLLLLVAFLWRQREQERRQHAWLVQAAGKPSVDGDEAGPPATGPAAYSAIPEVAGYAATTAAVATPQATPSVLTAPGLGEITQRLPPVQPLQAVAQKREVSVEELIDLEQQAEFFVVLGQDDAAIDLLMGHLRGSSGTSPLPYLKLLEIYKRRGDRKEYERMRERFNGRFNAYAPAWETDLQDGRTLEDYPQVIERLVELWSMPASAMQVLQASLLRAEGTESEDSFDLPAYRELMMLYSVARDLSEQEAADTGVDLLLPLDETPGGRPSSPGLFEPLAATTSIAAQPVVRRPLSIDLHLDDLEPPKS